MFRVVALALLVVTGVGRARAVAIDGGWTVVVGADSLERTAAEDLCDLIAERWGVRLQGPVNAGEFEGAGPAIHIGTTQDHPVIAEAHERQAFELDRSEGESYHAAFRDGDLYIVGATPKGAMNGAFRFDDRRSLDVSGLDVRESPAFHFRVGGHKMNQHPPADWSERDQARYYARNYINVIWGEKKGPPISAESRAKYGLGLMVELRLPPADKPWLDDPTNASAVYRLNEKRDWRVVDPFDPKGRQAYLDGYRKLLADHPDVRILYAVFADYNAIPDQKSIGLSDGLMYPHTRAEGMRQILGIMSDAIGEREILPIAWLWHGFFGNDRAEAEFMIDLAARGYGALYNEAGNNDNWIIKRNNFNETATLTGPDGTTAYGEKFVPLVSAGGACESINPVIGLPVPHVAATKIRAIADLGVRHVCIWWGGYEGWVYQPNNHVVAEMIWNPYAFDPGHQAPFDAQEPEALMRLVAERDFGRDLAPDVLEFWRLLDEAVVTNVPLYRKPDDLPPPDTDGLHIYDWFQRMGTFTESVFGGAYLVPLVPDTLVGRREFKAERFWGEHPHVAANYESVLAKLDRAIEKVRAIETTDLSPDVAQRISDMANWTDLYRRLLRTQHNFYRAIGAMREHKDRSPESVEVRAALEPIVRDEIANGEAVVELLPSFPANMNVRQNMEGTITNKGSVASEIAAAREKLAAMRIWLERRRNIAVGAAAIASSQEHDGIPAAHATDGDAGTRWGSRYADDEWLAIDLGQVRPIDCVVLNWNAAHAEVYEIQISTEPADPVHWTTVYRTTSSNGGVDTILLDAPFEARWIRVKGEKRATGWGYSLHEVQVFSPS